ncbi:hypothetical protein MUDAN_DOGOELCO_01419 [Lactiplantibacillus mudanjiangensis]|uniref:hypothetical protein n=1 Tax=Lactiplantibacillus mudanjiangensis TaxID=1296538 RepID=UPI0010142F17|nr:hypothetical protein [Lactiplantibacillus mudanjiangensis]VDG32128.1 hypothetical protein MUDAN_DOGOELCO_01419 [Lactiplantibacillus mudanjiangensis]
MNESLKAGFGKASIDFNQSDLPIREFAAKMDDLYVRVMLIHGHQDFALVSFDLTSLTNAAIDQFKAQVIALTGIPTENIWITVTHTFAAPHLPSQPDKAPQPYRLIFDKLTASLSASCIAAQQNQQPVQIGSATVDCSLNVNRNLLTTDGWWLGRNFQAYSNHQLRVLAFKQATGQTHLIVNYDIQQSVLDHVTDDHNQRMISSDLMGYGLKSFETNDQVAIFLPGAAGDQRPLFVGDAEQPFAVAKAYVAEQGAIVTERLQHACQAIDNWQALTQLTLVTQAIQVPTQVQELTTFELKPTHHYNFEAAGQTMPLSVTALCLNQHLIAGTQPELNSAFANQCRDALNTNATTMVVTLINGGAKYLPTALDYQRITYQAMNTPLAQGADQLVLQTFAQVGAQIRKEVDHSC